MPQHGWRCVAGLFTPDRPDVTCLAGKDPFIVLQDAELAQVVPTAMRGAFQSSGQNCAGAERFFIHKVSYD
eukprot:scaffold1839_cov382-Prasinococcus_capsulatus_cf.AAC.19